MSVQNSVSFSAQKLTLCFHSTGPSRCFPFWQEVLACYVVNVNSDDSSGAKKCAPALEDYYECLHHHKEVWQHALDASPGRPLTISIESESSSITGRIPQKRSPKPTNRCANSWRNPTARATEGLLGGKAHQTFEMATSCEGQCIIDEELWVINEERIDSKEPRLMDPETPLAKSLHICMVHGL